MQGGHIGRILWYIYVTVHEKTMHNVPDANLRYMLHTKRLPDTSFFDFFVY